jgi:hypothetical protein
MTEARPGTAWQGVGVARVVSIHGGSSMNQAAAITKADKHPLDFEKLAKDTWLETKELEEATLASRHDAFFPLKVQGLIAKIERKTGILGRAEGNSTNMKVRLMTDSEALEYNIREAGRASRKLERCADRLIDNIDRTRLSDIEQQIHDHARRMIGAMADAQKREKRQHAELFQLMHQKAGGGLSADALNDPGEF